MLEAFNEGMIALADAVRAKFGLSGTLTVADMVTAVSGLAYTSAGATLAGFDADMYALADAIRVKAGITGSLTIDRMAAAVAAISLGYTSFVDESLCEEKWCGSYNRIGIILPSGEYTGVKIYGIGIQPYCLNFGANATGTGGIEPEFAYSDGTVTVGGTVPGGRLCLTFSSDYEAELGVIPQGNGTPGFSWPQSVYAATSAQTPAFSKVFLSGYCLKMTFDGFTAATATSNDILTCTDTVYVDTGDEITPEMEEAYFQLLDKMSRANEAAAGKTAFNEVTYD